MIERHLKEDSFGLVMQVRIGSELGTTLWTHQERIEMEHFLWICQMQMY